MINVTTGFLLLFLKQTNLKLDSHNVNPMRVSSYFSCNEYKIFNTLSDTRGFIYTFKNQRI